MTTHADKARSLCKEIINLYISGLSNRRIGDILNIDYTTISKLIRNENLSRTKSEAAIKDISGKRFTRLTVVKFLKVDKYSHAVWECLCDCGETVNVSSDKLNSNNTKSCGCLFLDTITKHKKRDTPEYKAWLNLCSRCRNKNNPGYKNYGGRGIYVCERWNKNFENFLSDMGERPGSKYSIERIDNNGPYSPENCKWATKDDQVNNRRTNKLLHYKGETLTITQWAKKLNIKPATLNGRLLKNWQIERALTEPVKKRS